MAITIIIISHTYTIHTMFNWTLHSHTHIYIYTYDVPDGKGPGQNNHNDIQALNLIKDSNKSH